jgi:hypothetical protein
VPDEVSGTLNQRLNRERYTSDCVAGYAQIDELRFYIMNFNTSGKTYCIDTRSGLWSELGLWNRYTGKYEQYELNTFTRNDYLGCLAGGRLNAKLFKINKEYYENDGQEIRTLIRTPSISWGTPTRKFVKKLMIGAQRTVASPESASSFVTKILVRWRDDGKANWSPWRETILTPLGRTTWNIELNRCGSYISRQYEIAMLGGMPFCITYVKEDTG